MPVSRLALVRARVSLPLTRRATGFLAGRHRSVLTGHGQDFDDLRHYEPGDDVGDIDWKASARAGEPIIRRFAHESSLTVVLLVDTGRTMTATAAGGEEKSAVADYTAAVTAYLAASRGDRVALLAGDADRFVHRPARVSAGEIEATLRALEATWSADAPPSDLGVLLRRALSTFRRRCLVVLVTDEAQPWTAHERLLKLLAVQHEVLVVTVEDLDPVGSRAAELARERGGIADVTNGWRVPGFLRSRRRVREAVGRALAERRAETEALLSRRRLQALRVASTDEVVPALVDLMRRQRRAR
ncbi:DUF58 domain-containing protein [Isoptericola croceus]|uniref:DUF58 domain-containing protein n=1 Tax=Isoptericola croceus TaxID=3031406 RepID=UPI0023FA3F1A|nr:DUF58 domain-containing protein [Isoptericola croceus]